MAPKKSNATGSSTTEISQMIADQIAAAIPTIVSQLDQGAGGSGGASGSGAGAGGAGAGGNPLVNVEDPPRGCSYKAFIGCKPAEYTGEGGAVGVLHWIEEPESVFEVCNCAEDSKVKFSTHTLKGKDLTWWNTEIRTRGRAQINAMTWAEFKEVIIAEYCTADEVKKLESEFWNLTMQGADIQGYNNWFHELSLYY
ncbi:MAG: hypothetical protein Q8886_02770, partial [Candidatus Phytoplasma australasiaticum]|nr:hypothetical protein [Candidatus Phytoplasma australasiaticum]